MAFKVSNHIILIASLCAVLGFGLGKLTATSPETAAKKETAFERVMRTGTLRCGYYNFAPMLSIDPNTKKPSGFSVDLMNIVSERTGLKIEWTEEITFGNWIPAIQAGRVDTVCTPLWADSSYARAVHFTQPLFFGDIIALVRNDETRFSSDRTTLNDPSITLSVQENNMTEKLAKALFPKAKTLSAPSSSDYGLILENVVSKKADMTFWSHTGFRDYEKNNKGKLKILQLDKPLKVIPVELPVLRGHTTFLAFLDDVLEDIIISGDMDRLIDKWEDPKGTWFRPASLYTPPTR